MSGVLLPPLALVGKAGAGKDTAAQELTDMAGYTRFALADPLKDMAEQLWGTEARRDRHRLQLLGRKVREVDQDAWVNVLRRRIKEWTPGVIDRPVVTDVRYQNEVYLLRVAGYTTIRVEADFHLRVARLQANGKLQDMSDLNDQSEVELDGYKADYTVTNNGSPEELAEQLADVLNRLRA